MYLFADPSQLETLNSLPFIIIGRAALSSRLAYIQFAHRATPLAIRNPIDAIGDSDKGFVINQRADRAPIGSGSAASSSRLERQGDSSEPVENRSR